MTRMLAIIAAALVTGWIPSEAARLGAQHPAVQVAQPASAHELTLQNRFSHTALR